MDADLQHAAENIVLKNIQSGMAAIRDKVAKSNDVLRELRLQNAQLEKTIAELQGRLAQAEKRNSSNDQNFVEVGDRLLYFSPDEREALERQINDLLNRVQSHLR